MHAKQCNFSVSKNSRSCSYSLVGRPSSLFPRLIRGPAREETWAVDDALGPPFSSVVREPVCTLTILTASLTAELTAFTARSTL
jgi:hypothetical protein